MHHIAQEGHSNLLTTSVPAIYGKGRYIAFPGHRKKEKAPVAGSAITHQPFDPLLKHTSVFLINQDSLI